MGPTQHPYILASGQRSFRRGRTSFLLLALIAGSALGQSSAQEQPLPAPDTGAPAVTVFPHSTTSRWLLSGQANIVFQSHPGFHSPYAGANSLLGRGEYKVSLVGTLFTGFQLKRDPRFATDFLFDLEAAGGRGISEALGLAGFTNLDVVRNPSLGSKPYVARVQLHQVLALSSKLVEGSRTPFSLSTRVPERRIDLRAGRLSLPDFLDLNGPGSDSHLQFLNWTAANNGAWDYAADTRGYTYALVAEYDDRAWSARYVIALMPTVANGTNLDWNLRRARGENFEAELRRGPASLLGRRSGLRVRKGAVRLLAFVNHADMGVYRDANKRALADRLAMGNPLLAPEIAAHLPTTTVKYGVGLNFEQELPANLRLFGRFGWNEGQHESFAYTEVDQTFALGRGHGRATVGQATGQVRRRRDFKRHQAGSSGLPWLGRPRVPARGRPPAICARGHLGGLLHRPQLARTVHPPSTCNCLPIRVTTPRVAPWQFSRYEPTLIFEFQAKACL